MFKDLNGPAAQTKISVTTGTVSELKAGSATLTGRMVITIQADGKYYLYFGNTDVGAPSVATIQANGFIMDKGLNTVEASDTQPVYVLGVSATVNIRFAERA